MVTLSVGRLVYWLQDIVIVSGFHSKMERDVLKILLQEECGIIVVLPRGMYRKLPKQYEEAMLQNRLLIISYEKESVTRISEATAHKRNVYVKEVTDEFIDTSYGDIYTQSRLNNETS